MTALGVPDEYEVFIADSLTEAVLVRVPWVSLQWQRINRGISAGSVTVDPTQDFVGCCELMDTIHAWDQLLVVERNGHRVWDGLITGWSTGQNITINAFDRSILLNKRFIGQDLTVDNTSTFDGFQSVIIPLLFYSGIFASGINASPCKVTVANPAYLGTTGEVGAIMVGTWRVVSLTSVGAVLQQIASSGALNYTQRNDKLFISVDFAELSYNQTSPDDLGLYYNTDPVRERRMVLSPQTTYVEGFGPPVSVDATEVYTIGYNAGTGQGVAGFPEYTTFDFNTFGTGAYVPYVLHGTRTEAQLENGIGYLDGTGTLLPAALNEGSAVRVSIEQIELAPTFGGDILKDDLSNLLPGIGISIDYPDACSMNVDHETWYVTGPAKSYSSRITLGRLEELNVSVEADGGGIKETVTVSLTVMADGVLVLW